MVNYRCFAILLVAIPVLVSICYLSVAFAQEKCLNFYSFESSSDSPKNDINWNMSNNNHHMGTRSLQSCGEARSEYKTNVIGPADISFWWTSNKGQDGIYFYQRDDGEIFPYTGTGWQKKTDSISEGSHSLKWVFSKKRSQSISGWIDDICIAKKPCNEACPEVVSANVIIQNTSLSTEIIDEPYESQIISTNISSTSNEINPYNFTEPAPVVCPLTPELQLNNDSRHGIPQEILVVPCRDNGYDRCSKIQTAIDRVAPGGTVTITNGDYYEKLIINKSIKLTGVDKNKTSIVGVSGGESIINICSNNVLINNLSIKGGKFGIEVENASNSTISNNIFEKNMFGINVYGCSNSHLYINNNTFLDIVKDGIRLLQSSDVFVLSNNMSNVKKFAIILDNSYKNKIIGNLVKGTANEGFYLMNSGDNTLNNNTFNGPYKCRIYLQDSDNNLIDSNMGCKERDCGKNGQNCACCN